MCLKIIISWVRTDQFCHHCFKTLVKGSVRVHFCGIDLKYRIRLEYLIAKVELLLGDLLGSRRLLHKDRFMMLVMVSFGNITIRACLRFSFGRKWLPCLRRFMLLGRGWELMAIVFGLVHSFLN